MPGQEKTVQESHLEWETLAHEKENALTAGNGQGTEQNNAHKNNNTPVLPKQGTQAARLLAALQSGRRITPLEAWREFAIMRLADPVFKLRRMGWTLDTIETASTNHFGEPVNFASYRLGVGNDR